MRYIIKMTSCSLGDFLFILATATRRYAIKS
jgi:hypothetical protein